MDTLKRSYGHLRATNGKEPIQRGKKSIRILAPIIRKVEEENHGVTERVSAGECSAAELLNWRVQKLLKV
jgi:hypothetical protein